MPWHLVTRGGKHCVAKEGSDEPIAGGCHDTKEEAARHMAALYKNYKDAEAIGAAVGVAVGGERVLPA